MTRRNTRKWGFLVLLAVLLLGCQEEPMEPAELTVEDRVLDCPLTITVMEMEEVEKGGFPSQFAPRGNQPNYRNRGRVGPGECRRHRGAAECICWHRGSGGFSGNKVDV